MPIKYKYNEDQPHYASYRIGDKEVDIIAGKGDVIELPDEAEKTKSIINLVAIGVLVKVEETKPYANNNHKLNTKNSTK